MFMNENEELPKSTIRALQPDFLTRTKFDGFGLAKTIQAALKEANYQYCTPIQAQTLPVSLKGADVAGQAQTGTGKTAAFLITVFMKLIALPDRKPQLPSALIVAPTRELAMQIYNEAAVFCRHTGLRQAQIIGGIDYQKQANILKKGTDIVICTPGRIIDYMKQQIFKTSEIKIVVIDEADRLLDLGFAKDMRYILSKLPPYQKRQTLLFSATLSHRVMELTYDYMNVPESISVTPENIAVEGVEQVLFHIEMEKKLPLLLGLIAKEEWDRLLIFANTKAGVDWLAQKLTGNGLPAEGISGNLTQPKRIKLMERFKNGEIKILVATDVASRGIHVDDISHVINYDLPQDAENYIHRIGRTARAGKTGRALSLACERYVYHLEPLEKILGYKIPVIWPEEDWYIEDVCGPVTLETRNRPNRASDRRSPRRSPESRKGAGKKGKTPTGRSKKPWKKSTDHYPGQFFGFSPSPNPPLEGKDNTKPQPKTVKPTPSIHTLRERRLKRRRKKKITEAPSLG
jgi:ATP-dependent RNA helicase RhlB